MFDKPITGIVGPNGSGKSNISDAILWVMGEQSTRTLRGGKMEDVIFGGTQRRSQVGYAEVSLVLDNSDGRLGLENSEVMITRRYYRSGESEYYINKSVVRLKDMNELFMDTGLGREGYSVIGQGRIADVLSTKSKDRREIFEEAAGISRYRHRKEESERKLAQTVENLVRISDIISELELQVEPLREQAETARKYLLLRDELRGLEIAMWLRELETLKERAAKAEVDLAAARIQLENASSELENGFADVESASEEMRKCDVDADAVRELISSAESRLSDVESAAAVLRSQLEGNAEQIVRLDDELKNQDSRQDGVGAQIDDRAARLGEIAAIRELNESKSSGLLDELQRITGSAGKGSDDLGSLSKTENYTLAEINEEKSELSALASQAQELYDRENSLSQELSNAAEALSGRKEDYNECVGVLDKIRENVSSLTNVMNGLELKAQNRVKKADTAREKLDRVSHELQTLESRRNILSEMEKEYQGYSKSVKLIMQESARGAIRNIHGTVGSLLKTGDKYTAAIETALGGAIQNIIVDSEDDGKSAINYLKRRDAGRATFLPVSTIRGNTLTEKGIENEQGFEGVALDLVEFDAKYAGIYASLLGRVVITDNLNNAVNAARRHGYRFRIVTLDGQVVNTGGSMTGGSLASNVGVLSRANELEQLAERIDTLSTSRQEAEHEYSEALRLKNASEYEIETARTELNDERDKLIRQESEANLQAQLIQAASEAIDSMKAEISTLNQRIKNNGSATDTARTRISTLEKDAQALRDKINEALRGQEQLTLERERVNEALSELRAETAALDSEKDALEKAVSELNALREEMSGSRDRQIETIDGLRQRSDEIRSEILEKERASGVVAKEIEGYKKRLSGLSEQKLEIEAQRGKLNKMIQEKNQEILNLERECSRLEQRKVTAELEEKQIVDKLWDTYELSRSAAVNSAVPVEDPADAQRRITSLKRQISELGTPNIGAIDEFERVNTRYMFLTSQRDDVEKAKGEITGIIGEITAQMKDVFTREFSVINESFEKTFRELFGGGRASLVLEDPEDVLECGIDIRVQPPGKSLRTLTLLSGGEKAFVAIAIYFAILTVRPPPFIVMDEIEAALDEANVVRFAEHMRRMSNLAQLIVITHRRATMEESDILYGVTMQELGVSSILRIDLDEAEKHMKGAARYEIGGADDNDGDEGIQDGVMKSVSVGS